MIERCDICSADLRGVQVSWRGIEHSKDDCIRELRCTVEALAKAQANIAAKVRQHRWVLNGNMFTCANCGYKSSRQEKMECPAAITFFDGPTQEPASPPAVEKAEPLWMAANPQYKPCSSDTCIMCVHHRKHDKMPLCKDHGCVPYVEPAPPSPTVARRMKATKCTFPSNGACYHLSIHDEDFGCKEHNCQPVADPVPEAPSVP